MIETPISFLQVDHPAAGAVVAPGRHAVQGWIMPKLRGGFADVRMRVDDRVFPGMLGHLRPDLAQHFLTGRSLEPAGFEVNVVLAPGPRQLIFEALQIEGVWQEVGTVDLRVDPQLAPVDFPVPSAPVRWREFGHLLRRMLTSSRTDATPEDLAREVMGRAPFPRDLLQPKPPFFGKLAEPAALASAADGFLDVSGYLFHATGLLRRVLVTTDLQVGQPLRFGLATPDVATAHFRIGSAKACGFAGRLFVPAQLPNPVALRFYAELADGTRHLCLVARTWRSTHADEVRPFAPTLTTRFDECVTALRRAIAAHQLALVTDATYDREVTRLRTASASQLPPPPVCPAEPPLPSPADAPAPQALRAAWKSGENTAVVVGMDATATRAGHHALAHAAEHLRRRYPDLAATCRIVLASSTAPAADASLSDLLSELNHPSLRAADQAVPLNVAAQAADVFIDLAATSASTPPGDPVALAEHLARALRSRAQPC